MHFCPAINLKPSCFVGFVQLVYKIDCEELYGKILDTQNVVSSVEGTCKKYTEEIWNEIYPSEPYELNTTSFSFTDHATENILTNFKSTKYDLVAAVKRQIPFFYQVMNLQLQSLITTVTCHSHNQHP